MNGGAMCAPPHRDWWSACRRRVRWHREPDGAAGAFEKPLLPCGSCPGMSTSRPRGMASANQRALLLAAKNDHHPALEELLRRYEPLIGAIVAPLRLPGGCEPADIAQEARLGLLRAIRAWQPARGPFPAFAALCARNQALRALDAAGARKHQFLNHARSLDDHEPRVKAPLKSLNGHVPAKRDTRTRRKPVLHPARRAVRRVQRRRRPAAHRDRARAAPRRARDDADAFPC